MKPYSILRTIALLSLATSLFAGPRDAMWKKVDEALQKGLPKTAIDELNPIITDSIADEAYAEAVKAITRKIALEGKIQGNKSETVIVRLEAETPKAPAKMKPVLETVLADWYWNYFQQNRWRFLQRTQTEVAPGTDIQTWDLARILAEIDRHFTAALADESTLEQIPVGDFDEILVKGSVSDAYRPTLYDFLAHQALLFYQTGEQGSVHAEDAFELDANSPIFAGTDDFLAWQSFEGVHGAPVAVDPASPLLKAIRLYQKLLRYHQADTDRSAFHEADLARLVFGFNSAVGDNKADRYKASLERFIAQTEKNEISARARASLASLFQNEGNPAEAHAIAQRGLDSHPGTAGGEMCFNLIQQIEAKSAQLSTEFVWNAPSPTLDVTYKNVTKVYFRAVPVDFEEFRAQTPRRITPSFVTLRSTIFGTF